MELAPYPWQRHQWQRLMQQQEGDRLAHAYLLMGECGLGKRHFALSAAARLLCTSPADNKACGNCRSCQLLGSGSNPDLLLVEPEDSKVIKIDQVRQLAEFSSKTSHSNSRKVVILQQAEVLNVNAANALLKTLEEPPASTVLLLVSDNPGRLLPTIRSRCQRILFAVPNQQQALEWLAANAPGETGLEGLLLLAANRPVQALELLHSDELQDRDNVLTGLAAVLVGKLDPVDFSATGKTIGAEKIMDWLWQTSSLTVKHLLLHEPPEAAGQALRLIYQALAGSARSEDEILARLLGINQAAEEARQQLIGASNPNPQLVLEGILWRWSRLVS
ncbi:MAG: DNA polymerase III subunit delta' [Gammaproteobacteria bacterium]|jgi:DNA polymerase-3 subunit delta'